MKLCSSGTLAAMALLCWVGVDASHDPTEASPKVSSHGILAIYNHEAPQGYLLLTNDDNNFPYRWNAARGFRSEDWLTTSWMMIKL